MALEPESFLKNHLKLWMQPLKKILELSSLKNNPMNNNYIFTMKKLIHASIYISLLELRWSNSNVYFIYTCSK